MLSYKMKVTYDPEADAMYIYVKEAEVKTTKEIDENTIIDLDKDGNLIGIELLFVKERLPDFLKELKEKKMIHA